MASVARQTRWTWAGAALIMALAQAGDTGDGSKHAGKAGAYSVQVGGRGPMMVESSVRPGREHQDVEAVLLALSADCA